MLTPILSTPLSIQQAKILYFNIKLIFPICQHSALNPEWIGLLYPSLKSMRKQCDKGKCDTLYYTTGMKGDFQSLYCFVHTAFILFSKLIEKK